MLKKIHSIKSVALFRSRNTAFTLIFQVFCGVLFLTPSCQGEKGSQSISTCFRTDILIFEYTIVIIKQHCTLCLLFTFAQQNSLFMSTTKLFYITAVAHGM